MKRIGLFRRTRAIEAQIDEFLDSLSQAAICFELGVRSFLAHGPGEQFEARRSRVNELEREGDSLRRTIEAQLYSYTLIPDFRGDVLGLLENLDSILNLIDGTLWSFSIEEPDIHAEARGDFERLAEMAREAVESIVLASRAFFRNVEAVNDHMHKVFFFEKEADIVSTRLKRAIFAKDMPLSHKTHLRDFVEQIDNIADRAEDVADRLVIYTIKRRV